MARYAQRYAQLTDRPWGLKRGFAKTGYERKPRYSSCSATALYAEQERPLPGGRKEKKMIKITYEWLEEHTYRGVGLKRKQAEILGLHYPLEKGWKQKAAGMRISDKDAEKFSELGSHPRRKNAVNKNNDREFLGKHKQAMKKKRKNSKDMAEPEKTTSFEKQLASVLSPAVSSLTFDDLEPVDLSLLNMAGNGR